MSGTYTSIFARFCLYRSKEWTYTSTLFIGKAEFQTLSIIRAAAS